MFKLDVRIDHEYKLAYVYLQNGNVAQTEMVHNDVNIDLDSTGEIIGIEFLNTNELNFTSEVSLSCQSDRREEFCSAIIFAQEKVREHLNQ